ncbi:MAG: arginine--tRNA ligase [Pseudomonadota bacterium]
MQTLPDLLGALVLEAIEAVAPGLALDGPAVQATADASLGDYQSNLAFRLTKALRRPPVVCAQAVVDALPAHPALRSVEVLKGFINLRLDDAWLAEQLLLRVRSDDLALPRDGAGKRVVIDYGSPNVAKRMHVGHLRSTNIGDALARMMRALGFEVVGDNHIGDWGTQFGKLMVAWERWRDEGAFAADAIGELQRLYVLFGTEAEKDPALEDDARAATAALQAGDPDRIALWHRFVEASLVEFDGVYSRMGVRFDVTLGESFYQPMLAPLVEDLQARGLAEEDDGALVVRFDSSDGKGLGDSPMLVRKRDGAALYATTDLAALRYRQERWTPDAVVYVTDVRQQLHFRQVFAAAKKAGLCEATLEHVWFGMLTLPEGVMANRKGNVIRLEALLDEAANRARTVVDEKSPDIPEEERAAIAEAVGVSAVRYADLSQNPQSNVVFDWDRMLALEGNTAPFLMYSYARCRSIQRKAGIEDPAVERLTVAEPAERDLALALLRYPEALRTALAARRPNMLCDYLFGLAGAFNRFYYQVPVLRAEEPALVAARLGLVEATARVLGAGMGLVGVRTLDRM